VRHEGREARAVTGTSREHPEAKLRKAAGRAATPTARPATLAASEPPAYRLKRTIDLFPASDGSLYLLRTGVDNDFVVRNPSRWDRAVLERLAHGYIGEKALASACEQMGLPGEGVGEALADLEQAGLVERGGNEAMLSAAERERYDRQLIYFSDLVAPGGAAEDLQRRLANATVAVVGTGGLGTWTACGLVCAGVGGMVLIDDDHVEVSNLNRQLLFGEADVGEPKIEAARRALLMHNSALQVTTVDRRVRGPDDLDDVLERVDLLIATADWPPYDLPRWINEACLAADTPYITAGQVLPLSRVGPTVIPGRSACLECEERQHRRTHPLYDELAEFRTANPADVATLGAACGVVGAMLAMEAIHLLTGAIQPASLDAALILDLRTMIVTREEVTRDPVCPACGDIGRGR
jgi:molybdopterin-synthase adenylyltransferase